ncbi:ribonuclease H-like domain-containing protein [Novosphingobium resinovorum]|uniref:ribonuclease H-like domain-containing protein n=1 Tax=Novosphingobium TaxID=165696 RepID=UPI001B3C9589|nr:MULTISPECIES: ribonuclease H-like domain-containing protein [Novosphingobium]MBF7012527.1 ribonuclease H-like domain-containing protein [Novosphingobium sp. HR1a]WJM27261.1 ribonuclease H-like domain-containing protein [Novosphingobium resinovorum]
MLDIETKPATAYVWGFWDQRVGAEQVIAPGGTICVGAKFVGDKQSFLFSEWEHGHQGMLEGIHALMDQADALITYNGDKFDLPILNGEFALAGMTPPAPATSIDVFKSVRRLKLGIHKLGYVGPRFGLGNKLTHEGFGLWKGVMNGDPKSQKKMARYCVQDVKLLEKLYLRVLPYITNHPHLVGQPAHTCPACSSTKLHSRGWRRTRTMQVQRLQCQDCGSWHYGSRKKVT